MKRLIITLSLVFTALIASNNMHAYYWRMKNETNHNIIFQVVLQRNNQPLYAYIRPGETKGIYNAKWGYEVEKINYIVLDPPMEKELRKENIIMDVEDTPRYKSDMERYGKSWIDQHEEKFLEQYPGIYKPEMMDNYVKSHKNIIKEGHFLISRKENFGSVYRHLGTPKIHRNELLRTDRDFHNIIIVENGRAQVADKVELVFLYPYGY